MSERLIVIGGGGAGTAAATIAKRTNPDMHVTLFTEFEDNWEALYANQRAENRYLAATSS